MLTIRQITIAGDEHLYEARNVRLIKAIKQGSRDTLWADFGEDRVEGTIDGGTVFVMNRHGSTIARYDLGASPVPLGIDVTPADDRKMKAA